MILKTCFILVLNVAWEVSAASYSNVYVQTGVETAPAVEYFQYGAPAYNYEYASPVAQYKTAPVGLEYPNGQSYSYRTVYSEPVIASVAQATPTANIVAYNAPTAVSNLPVVLGGRADPAGYEYSYVLVNQDSGQELKQLSDSEAIRGRYTLLQPGALVQYVSEDNQGFNVIFKKYLSNEHTETVHHETAYPSEPCQDAKSAAIAAHMCQHEEIYEEPRAGHLVIQEDPLKGNGAHPEEHEARHGAHEEVHEHTEHSQIEHHSGHEAPHESETDHEDHITIILKGGIHEVELEDHGEHHKEGQEHSVGHHEIVIKEEDEKHELRTHGSDDKVLTHENLIEKPVNGHEHNAGPETTLAVIPEYPVVGNNVFISYNDFIKCIQAAMTRSSTHPYYAPVPKPPSPLTYLIFNKPC